MKNFAFRFIIFPVIYFFILLWSTIFSLLSALLHYFEFVATMQKATHLQLLQKFGLLPKQKKYHVAEMPINDISHKPMGSYRKKR